MSQPQRRRRRSENEPRYTHQAPRREIILDQLNDFKKSKLNIVLLIEALLVVLLFAFLGLPIAIAIAALAIFFALLVSNTNKKNIPPPKLAKFIAIIYIFIVAGGIQLFGVLDSLIARETTSEFYVITTKENPVDKISELEQGETIGLSDASNYQTYSFPKTKFSEEGYDFKYSTYDTQVEAVNSLLSGVESYVVVSDPKADILKDISGYDNTKVIAHYKETEKINSNSKNVTREPFTVLITGVDTRDNSIDENSRSDSIMIAKINPKTKEVKLVSLPRDSYIYSTCIGSEDKLTHSSLGGMNCITSDIEQLLGIKIDYYVKVNFYSVIEAIDAVGGIEIDVESSFCGQDENDKLDAFCFDSGLAHMNGEEALSYARERKSFSDGDYARARHQQQVIDGFLQSLSNSNLLVISKLLNIAGDSARTNLSTKQLTQLILMSQSGDGFQIESYTVTGYSSRVNIPYWELYGTSVQELDQQSIDVASALLNE